MFDDFKDAGVFGMKQSGKTTLCLKMSLYFALRGRPTIALDPVKATVWGKHATKFSMEQEDQFFETAWREFGCLVVIEEASTTLQRDAEKNPVFNRLHHNNHKILVVGHGGNDLLPAQRRQLDQVFLFRQSKQEAKNWSEEFTRDEIMGSANLNQFEYMHCKRFEVPVIYKLEKI